MTVQCKDCKLLENSLDRLNARLRIGAFSLLQVETVRFGPIKPNANNFLIKLEAGYHMQISAIGGPTMQPKMAMSWQKLAK